MALATLPTATATAAGADTLARARAAMGRADLLADVRAIGWSGTLTVATGTQTLHLATEARVEPFVRARSDTWLRADGRHTRRTLMVEDVGGFSVIDGRQTSLSPLQYEHERHLFGLYGLLLLRSATAEHGRLRSRHPGLPDAVLTLGPDGRPTRADYAAAGPDGRPFGASFGFSGATAANGLRWFRRMTITRRGRPYLALDIADLAIER